MSHDEIPLSHTNDCDRPPLAERIAAVYERVTAWQCKTFPAQTIEGVVAHMRNELIEIEAAPSDISERADMAILAMALVRLKRGRTRSGDADAYRFGDHSPKDAIGRMREWLDKGPPDIELVRWLAIASFGTGLSGSQFLDAIEVKHAENLTRRWPRPEDQDPTKPIEHVREDSATRRGDDAIAEELVAPLLAERSAMAAAITKLTAERDVLTAEVDGLRVLDEVSRLEMERVRGSIHALKDETTNVAAARVWSNLLAAESRGRDVLSALGRPIGEDPVKAAQRIVRERDEAHDAVAKMMAERDDARRALELERADNVALRSDAALAEERVSKERAEWLANNEALRLERDDVRKVLSAQPNETVAMAAQRALDQYERASETCSAMKRDVDCHAEQRDRAQDLASSIAAALGVDVSSPDATAAPVIARAGQLRDDSVAYRSLRGRLVEVIGAPADFGDIDLLDLLKDRINGPITDAEGDLLDQVQQLEGDVTTLKAALHVATRGQS